MKNFKKVIAAGLALLMLALSVNVSFAAEEKYTEKEAIVVAKVNAAGIMQGTDKGFEPAKTLTRAEAAAIMVRMKGISEDTVKQNAGTTLFTDVAASHWAAGYINVASNYGIIVGVGAGKFAPEKEVSVAEFYTMATRALGAGKLVESEGTWPTNYVNFAIENDLAEDVAQLYTATATRITAATIVANTLEAKMWVKGSVKSNGEIEWVQAYKTILEDVLKIEEYRESTISSPSTKDLTASFAGKLYKAAEDTTAAADCSPINADVTKECGIGTVKTGVKYTVWYKPDDKLIVGFWVPTSTDAVEFTGIKSIDTTKNKIKLVVNGSEKEYDYVTTPAADETVTVSLKGNAAVSSFATLETARAAAINNISGVAYFSAASSNKDKILSVYAENYNKFAVVKEVTDKKISFESILGVTGANSTGLQTGAIYVDTKNKEYFVTKDGNSIELSDIEEGDAIFYFEDGSKYYINVLTDTVEGRISSKDSNNNVKIDGTKYESKYTGLNAGDEGTFYLNADGKIVMFDREKAAVGDVAMISAHRYHKDTYSNDVIVELKLTQMDGTTTDWLEINPESVEKVSTTYTNWLATAMEHSNKVNATEATAKTYGQEALNAIIVDDDDTADVNEAEEALKAKFPLGTAIACKINDGKVSFKNTVDSESHALAQATEGKFYDSKDYVLVGAVKYYATSDARVFEYDDNTETKEANKVRGLKEVSLDDLDDLKNNEVVFITDIDYNDHTFGTMVVSSSNIKGDRTWAFILNKYEYDDNDSKTKETFAYEVVYAGSTEVVELLSEHEYAAGAVYELEVVNNNILKSAKDKDSTFNDVTLTLVEKDDETRIKKQYTNGTITFAVAAKDSEIGAESAAYSLAEDLLVIKNDSGKYSVSDFASIKQLEKGTGASDVVTDDDQKNSNEIYSFVTCKDKTDATGSTEEIIAIIYNK